LEFGFGNGKVLFSCLETREEGEEGEEGEGSAYEIVSWSPASATARCCSTRGREKGRRERRERRERERGRGGRGGRRERRERRSAYEIVSWSPASATARCCSLAWSSISNSSHFSW
jgi:hypothetical protein